MEKFEETKNLLRRLEIAQRLARWAGHQWGHADLSPLENVPFLPYDRVETAVQVLTYATTERGPVGWGITRPDVFSDGDIVVGIGAFRQLGVVVRPSRNGLAWVIDAWYHHSQRVNCWMRAGHACTVWAGEVAPRDYVRLYAALAVAYGEEPNGESWLVSEEGRHYLATEEGQLYLRRVHDVGRLLAGPEEKPNED